MSVLWSILYLRVKVVGACYRWMWVGVGTDSEGVGWALLVGVVPMSSRYNLFIIYKGTLASQANEPKIPKASTGHRVSNVNI